MSEKITFKEYHEPALKSGEFILKTTSHKLDAPSNSEVDLDFKLADFHFAVKGERFSLNPRDIHSVYPPAAGLGDFSNVLPHIVLNRSTLPWERTPIKDGADASLPWMALLAFEKQELWNTFPKTSGTKSDVQLPAEWKQKAENGFVVSLKQLDTAASLETAVKNSLKTDLPDEFDDQNNSKNYTIPTIGGWPGLDWNDEVGQQPDDRTALIFVKKEKLEQLLPQTIEEVKMLAHTRIESSEVLPPANNQSNDKPPPVEYAIVMANRLPQAKADTIVHLVSLENRYDGSGFNFDGAAEDHIVPLISLKSWRFSSLSAKHNFYGKMLHLNHTPLFRIPDIKKLPRLKGILNGKTIPRQVREGLAKAGKPLNEKTGALDMDVAQMKLKSKSKYYLIGENGRVYDQAGLLLSNQPSDLEAFKNDFTQVPISEDEGYWWIEDEQNYAIVEDGDKFRHHFFLDIENDDLIVHQLFRDQSPTLRLPDTSNTKANLYLKQGYVPVPHTFRQGSRSVSWYHGPLSTRKTEPAEAEVFMNAMFTVNGADEILNFKVHSGLFDTAYAAAWELGRLLALKNKTYCTSLAQYKRWVHRNSKHKNQLKDNPHFPFGRQELQPVPPALGNWLGGLMRLEGIPFNYLIPDERILPPESLRFFYIDRNWMTALLFGALSIGRPLGENDFENFFYSVTETMGTQTLTNGFVMRSSIISGWPGLQIAGYSDKDLNKPIQPVRYQLGSNILFCLFEPELAEVDFFLKPEVIHHGFDRENDTYKKNLRNSEGKESWEVIDPKAGETKTTNCQINIPFKASDSSVVDIRELKNRINSKKEDLKFDDITAAQFALTLIEGSYRFKLMRTNKT